MLPVPLILIGSLVITTYIIYPIEVIAPGWITLKRIFKIYLPVVIFYVIYRVSLLCGVRYSSFGSLGEMFEHINSFEVIFRLSIIMLISIPSLLLWLVPYTRRYNNVDKKWIVRYIVVFLINTASYLLSIAEDELVVRICYYLISVLCSVYIFYQEIFVRLIEQPYPKSMVTASTNTPIAVSTAILPKTDISDGSENVSDEMSVSKERILFDKIESYVNQNQAWRDPDISMTVMVKEVGTNRRQMLEALQYCGYENYSTYMNQKRIADFIKLIESNTLTSYQDAFFEAGFRSRAAALRNFKQVTSMTPTQYFLSCKDQKTNIV